MPCHVFPPTTFTSTWSAITLWIWLLHLGHCAGMGRSFWQRAYPRWPKWLSAPALREHRCSPLLGPGEHLGSRPFDSCQQQSVPIDHHAQFPAIRMAPHFADGRDPMVAIRLGQTKTLG